MDGRGRIAIAFATAYARTPPASNFSQTIARLLAHGAPFPHKAPSRRNTYDRNTRQPQHEKTARGWHARPSIGTCG